jgi:hypothetical protein
MSLSVDGVFNKTMKMFSKRIANLPETYSADNPAGSPTNPWPIEGFSRILFQVTDGETNYKALQVGLTRRLTNRVQGQVSYTLSDTTLRGVNTHWYTPSKARGADDRGPSLNHMRHKLAVSGGFQLPWGVNLSTVIIANSGPAYRIYAATDLDGDSLTYEDRPDGLPMNQGGIESQENLDIINEFRRSWGLSEVTMDELAKRYPYFNVDLRVSKLVPLGRGANIELIAEMFNLFNRTNFNSPNGVLISPAFLTVSSAADPFEMQLAVRLLF